MDAKLKLIIYWFTLGAGLVLYAHANFSTVDQVNKIEIKVENQATSQDIYRLEAKIDKIKDYLLERK
jgi:hypothetical protein